MKNFSNIENYDSLISRYLSGDCSESETGQLINWLNISEENRRYFAQLKFIWLQSALKNGKSTDDRWEQLQTRLEQRESNLHQIISLETDRKYNFLTRLLAVAAIIVLLLGMTALFYYLNQSRNQTLPKQLTENIINVPYGSKLNLTLPDNSRVWINAGSKIVYNNNFGVDNRDIYIEGEAYFEVAKNPDLPFMVHAGKVAIKALGTAFNVKAYPEDHKIEATLVHGSIEIKKDGEKEQILLKPREKIILINREPEPLEDQEKEQEIAPLKQIEAARVKESDSKLVEEVTINKKINIEKETAWKDGKLIFESEPLESLCKAIMRKYDVKIEFADAKLKSFKFTGTFRDMPLQQLLDAMKFSSPIDYEIKEKNILIKGKN